MNNLMPPPDDKSKKPKSGLDRILEQDSLEEDGVRLVTGTGLLRILDPDAAPPTNVHPRGDLMVDQNGWYSKKDLNRVVRAMAMGYHFDPNSWFRNSNDYAAFDTKMPHLIFDRSTGDFTVVFYPRAAASMTHEAHKLTPEEMVKFFPAINEPFQ